MSGGSDSRRLSRREREVAALVAEGLTDREIARRLSIAERTAEGHVQQVRNKLGLDNRAQIATWMTKQTVNPTSELLGFEGPSLSPPSNLPAQLTSFIGRNRELGEIRRLLQRARLLTITGPGGCGKTRLAVQAAEEVGHRYPGGLWFVDLSPVKDPNVVPRAIAAAMGIRDREDTDPIESVAAELVALRRPQPCLIILDNCEHLAERCAETVEVLLRASPHLTFLCTSRERLRLAGEAIWNLAPLSLPQRHAPSYEEVRQAEAVRLFVDRASLSDPRFELSEVNAARVAELCSWLDGLPLALELAAARVGSMSLGELLERLEHHLGMLRLRASRIRQQTLGAAIGWSYDLLTQPEQRLLQRLSTFRGGFTLEAAEFVCMESDAENDQATFERVTLLVDKSLVVPPSPSGERYRCLHIIQRYASDRLAESGEMGAIRRRHMEFYTVFAERASRGLRGAEQPEWLARLGDDHDNLREALETSRGDSIEIRYRLVLALEHFWRIGGHLAEGREWIDEVLSASSAKGITAMRARALNAAAGLAWQQGNVREARAGLEASLAIWRQLGERPGIQVCLANLGIIASEQSDWGSARDWLEESLALARDLRDERATAIVLVNIGFLAGYFGEHDAAVDRIEEGLTIMRHLGDRASVAIAHANLGLLALNEGNTQEASRQYAASLHILETLGARPTLAECLEGFACIAARGGRAEQAVRLAGAAANIRETIGRPPRPWSQRLMDGWIDGARQHLKAAAQKVWRQGGELSVTEAIALALEERLDTKEVGPASD